MKYHVTHITEHKRLFQFMLSTKAGEGKIYGAQGSEEILLHNGNQHKVVLC